MSVSRPKDCSDPFRWTPAEHDTRNLLLLVSANISWFYSSLCTGPCLTWLSPCSVTMTTAVSTKGVCQRLTFIFSVETWRRGAPAESSTAAAEGTHSAKTQLHQQLMSHMSAPDEPTDNHGMSGSSFRIEAETVSWENIPQSFWRDRCLKERSQTASVWETIREAAWIPRTYTSTGTLSSRGSTAPSSVRRSSRGSRSSMMVRAERNTAGRPEDRIPNMKLWEPKLKISNRHQCDKYISNTPQNRQKRKFSDKSREAPQGSGLILM